MIDVNHFRDLVIDPVIEALGMYSTAASELLLGTAIQESNLTFLTQLDGDDDPYDDAMGFFQSERRTIIDIHENWLRYRELERGLVNRICGFPREFTPPPEAVIWNLRYAVCIARIHYRRVKEPLPTAGDLWGMAHYWKKYYNTSGGKGTPRQYVENWCRVHGLKERYGS